MARVQYQMPEDFLAKISALGSKTDQIIPKVLAAGGEVVLEKVRSNLKAVIGKGKHPSRSTGQLVEALGVSGARQDKNGDFNIKVGFSESRRDGRNNALIANVLDSYTGQFRQVQKP